MNRRLLDLTLRLGVYRWARLFNDKLRYRKLKARELAFLRRLIRPGALVFDVGANRGQSAEAYLRLGARVIAFEPQAALHEEILQRCQHLGDLKLEPVGLGSAPERRELLLKDCDQVASFDPDWEGGVIGRQAVEVSTLDAMIEKHGRPDYCKVDVEGWERHVIAGLSTPIALVSLEYHLSPENIRDTKDALHTLAELGPYEANVLQQGTNDWAMPTWMAATEFAERFSDRLELQWSAHFGEVFLRTV